MNPEQLQSLAVLVLQLIYGAVNWLTRGHDAIEFSRCLANRLTQPECFVRIGFLMGRLRSRDNPSRSFCE